MLTGFLFLHASMLFTSHGADALHLPSLAWEKHPTSPHHPYQSRAERLVVHPVSQSQHLVQATKLGQLTSGGSGQDKSEQPNHTISNWMCWTRFELHSSGLWHQQATKQNIACKSLMIEQLPLAINNLRKYRFEIREGR